VIAPRQIDTADGAEETASHDKAPSPEHSAATVEANDLARELAGAFGSMVQDLPPFDKHMDETWRELEDRANEPDDEVAKSAEVA
jgi:hypothetical protein